MIDFDRWFAGQTIVQPPEPEPDLPDGVWWSGPGVYMARCRSCDRHYELCYDVSEFTEDGNYCGGSDRCIP